MLQRIERLLRLSAREVALPADALPADGNGEAPRAALLAVVDPGELPNSTVAHVCPPLAYSHSMRSPSRCACSFALVFFIVGPPVGVGLPLVAGARAAPAFARHSDSDVLYAPIQRARSGDAPARRYRGHQRARAWRRGGYRRPCRPSMSRGGYAHHPISAGRQPQFRRVSACRIDHRRRAEIRGRRAQVPATPALTD